MSIIGTVHEDVTTKVLGTMGAFQWMVTVFTTTLMASTLFNQHEDMFLLKHQSGIVCVPPNGFLATNSTCFVVSKNNSEESPCPDWNIRLLGIIWLKKSRQLSQRLLAQWQITCNHHWKLFSTAMICRLGVLFGYIVYGLVADSFGRKRAMMLDVSANVVLRLSIVFCDSESWFKLLVFIRSLLGCANNYMGLILISEIASNRWRSRLSLVTIAPRIVALVCMVPLARAVANSESFSLVACIYDVVVMVMLRWTPESPQWLLFNSKINVAETTLYRAAKKNRIALCSDFKIRPLNQSAYYCLDENQTCISVLSTHNTRVLVLVCLLFWAVKCHLWSIMYTDVYIQDKSHYFLLKTLCFTFIIGCLTVLLSWKLRLRYLLMLNVLGAGVSEIMVMICEQAKDSTVNMLYAVSLAARMIGIALTLTISPRFFAINMRATLIGCCQAAGQLGAILGHLLVALQLLNAFTLGLLKVVASLALALMCLIFPDVDSREMPDVLDDMDYFSELSKPLRWATQKTHSPSYEEVEIKNHSFGSHGRPQASRSATAERAPAQRIGLLTLWGAITRCAGKYSHLLLRQRQDN